MLRIFLSILLTIGASNLAFATNSRQNRVEYLTPPRLSKETIAKQVVCIRPMRGGMFNISSEETDGKFVVHCYGHGGSGWTTLFGSIKEATRLLQKQYPSPDNAPPIRVVGSGCMGLGSAIELARLGYVVNGISTKNLYDTPSWNAGGYYGIFAVNAPPDLQETLNKINFFTFETYQLIEKGCHPYLSPKTVRFMPSYSSLGSVTGVEELEEMGLIPPHEIVDIDFGNGVLHKDFIKAFTYYFDVIALMKEMHIEASRLEIPVELKEVKSLSDIEESIVFNCAGLGGKELAGSDNLSMIPVRGHLLLLNEQAGEGHMDYMLGAGVKQDEIDTEVYFIPKSSFVSEPDGECSPARGVLGGTFIEDTERFSPEELQKFDEEQFEKLFERNYEFYYGKK